MIFHSGRSRGRHELNAPADRGATAVEYTIMVSLIALVIFAGVVLFGRSVRGLFDLIVSAPPFN
jgi:Flp pilus assembly pilin Flp